MKTIVIAAGYATRLYPCPFNPDADCIPGIDGHVIVTNHKFARHFEEWKKESSYAKPITVIDDGTSTNETRLGAVRDLLLAIDRCGIDDDIMVLAADNILEFSLRGFVDFFREKGTSVIMCHHEPELRRLQRTGVIAVDEDIEVVRESPTSMHGPCRPRVSTSAPSILTRKRKRDSNKREPSSPWVNCVKNIPKKSSLPEYLLLGYMHNALLNHQRGVFYFIGWFWRFYAEKALTLQFT